MKTQVLLIILLLFTSLSCVTATDLDNSLNESNLVNTDTDNHVINLNHNTHLKSIIKDLNEIYNISETLKKHYTNKINPTNNKRLNLFNNTSNNKINNNKSLINTSSNNTNINKSFVNNSSIHTKSNLVNLTINKNIDDVGLFNGTSYNQNQYNKTFKLLSLNHSINDNVKGINKELNNSKLNNSICDDSREDNFLINPVPESDNKDNMMFLILPFLLVLLGAIIVYKIKK